MFKRAAILTTLLLSAYALPAWSASSEDQPLRPPGAAKSSAAWRDSTDRVIVKFRETASAQAAGSVSTAGKASPVSSQAMKMLSALAGVDLVYIREMSTGAQVLGLPQSLPLSDVAVIARNIAANPAVEYAEADVRMFPLLIPNDTQFLSQWHLTDYLGGVNAPAAWDISTGSASTVVAVIDTGRTAHPDLDARMLPGYDFIADADKANDGDERDADPSDAGDWVTSADKATAKYATCDISNSSWHGTLVAGVIGATTNNGSGLAGVDWAARLLPVRVLGKCGAMSSDVADAMNWAAGNTVPGATANPNPAKILNLSLGGKGSCSNTYQNVVNRLVSAGKIIVVSAGNENTSEDHSPASCQGVISVAAVARSGSKASYSSYGSKVTLSAPGGDGGDLITLSNTGTTVPASPTIAGTSGTSFSAPVISGIVSLMLAIRPNLDSVLATKILTASVRPFPDSSCDTSTCGAGIIDAAAAVRTARDLSLGVAASVGFRDTDVGRPNADLALKITNLSPTPTTVNGGIVLNSADFLVSGGTCIGVPLNEGDTCNLTLRFNPAGAGNRQAEMVFSASDGRQYRVGLAGYAYPTASISEVSAGTSGGPQYIAKAPDGTYWYTQPGANRIARMTPSGDVAEYPLPSGASNPFDIIAGADGNMWFTELDGGRIGRITLGGVITEFALPVTTSQPRGIAAGADGNIWFTELTGAKIGRITPQGVITEFDIPWSGASPRGITGGPDGNLWFTDSGGLSIGRVTTAGTITRFNIPWASSTDSVRAITTGPDGNLWFTELTGNRIGRITPAGVLTQFPLPRGGAGPLGITAGPDGGVWYSANSANRVGRVDTSTGQISEYRLPSTASSPIGIITGPNKVMWIANSNTSVNKIARLSIPGVSGASNYSDMWWAGQVENGWGMSIQQHGNIQFNALYVYDAAGKPVWYVMPGGTWNADFTSYSGALYQPTSAPLNAYSPSQFVVGTSPGNATITFTSDSTATLQYTINGISGQKSIQRQAFGSGTSPLTVGDMWWGGSTQDGWGINLVQHGSIVFGVWYTYAADGKSTWYVLPTGTWAGTTYSGTLYSTTGSAWLGTAYNAGQLAVTTAGNLSFNFANANSTNMTYSFTAGPFTGVTQTKALVRQPY